MSKRLGEILVELGYVSAEHRDEALASSTGGRARFGQHLCELGRVRPQDVTHALALQYGLTQIHLKEHPIQTAALGCISADLAQRYRALPLTICQDRLEVAMADPLDQQALQDLTAICGLQIEPYYAHPGELADALRQYYGTSSARMAHSLGNSSRDELAADTGDLVADLSELVREPSLINLVNLIVLEAVQDEASDIHIEPFERELKIKYRIDGVLHECAPPPKHLQPAIISRIKIMAQLNIAERFVPQDGHFEFSAPHAKVDIRVSTVPTAFGESVVLRLLDKGNTLRRLGDLGMSDELLHGFDQIIRRPHGILLVTGPTGSGKTSTLYAALHQIFTPAKKFITIEDPVEFNLHGINQMQVNPKRGLTFANGLRSILRQDPDIIMVGEIRDGETADIAIRSALTGHLVLSSLHTNDAASACTRLLDMGVEPYLLATTVEAVVAQRLVRRLCTQCAETYQPSSHVLERLAEDAARFRGATLLRGRGCQECHDTGYRGRVGIFEMIRMNEPLRDLLMNRPSSSQIRRVVDPDFISLRQDGYRKVLDGVTTLDEVWRVTEDANGNGHKSVALQDESTVQGGAI